MGSQGENTALRVLLEEARMSNAALARAVVAAGAREGIHLGDQHDIGEADAGWLPAALAGAEAGGQCVVPAVAA
jgi:hypothetical protein